MTQIQIAIEAALTRTRLMSASELAREIGSNPVTVTKYLQHPRFVKHGREKNVHGRPAMLYKLADPVEESAAAIEHRAYRGALEAVAARQVILAALIRDLARSDRQQSARKLAEVWVMEDARLKLLCSGV